MFRNFTHVLVAAVAVFALSAPAANAAGRDIPSYYKNIDQLDYSAVSITATILQDQKVRRAVNDMALLGGRICRIAYVSHGGDKAAFEVRFVRVGSWAGPRLPPWHGSFQVNMQAPADGSLQVQSISNVKSIDAAAPDGWLIN